MAKLLTDIKKSELSVSDSKVGIRSQFFNPKDDKLVTDSLLTRQDHTIYVLNAISPVFSVSFAFGSFLVVKLEEF